MDVRLPDGTIINNVPEGTTRAQLDEKLKSNGYGSTPSNIEQPVQPKSYTGWQALTKGATNLIPSTANLAVGAGKAIIHPADTMQGLIQLVSGGISKALPESIMQYAIPEKRQQAEAVANAVGSQYKEKYGSSEGFKRAFAEDPASVLADISTVLTGGGMALKGAEAGSKAAKTAELVNTAATYTNPLSLTGKAIQGLSYIPSQLTKGTLGVTTGVGKAPIEEAIKAGAQNVLTGNETFIKNLRSPQEGNAVDIAKQAVDNLRQAKSQQYRSGMLDISKDKSILDLSPIDESIANARKSFAEYKGVTHNADIAKVLDSVQSKVSAWKSLDPAEFHTPEGLDKLKQSIGQDLQKIPFNETDARKAVGQIYNATKNTINSQAPTYAKVMSDYSKSSELVSEIEKGLSLGKKSTADAAMRKLQSIMRNNVTTNYGQRAKLAENLVKAGGENLMPALAGQSMSATLPRGLGGQFETYGGLLAATTNPSILLGAPLASPRLMGETLYKYGQLKGLSNKGVNAIPLGIDQSNAIANLLYQLNQNQQ